MNIEETTLYNRAREIYAENGCQYHNWAHVERCFEHVEEVHDYLQLAIVFHDIVYDNLPNKEFRSAEKMMSMYRYYKCFSTIDISNETLEKAYVSILATTNHKYSDWPAYTWPMIRADLGDLTIPERVIENYVKILNESQELSGISIGEFAENNIKFMTGLRNTCHENSRLGDADCIPFWREVIVGIDKTIELSRAMME